jgi:ketosteroid isomerase-like protein
VSEAAAVDGPDPAEATAAVLEHIGAFNAHSTQRLLAGLAPDAVWRTGSDVVRGLAALADLFDPWVWSLAPSLTVTNLVAEGTQVAAQLIEQLTVDGELRRMDIAAFFDVRDGKIVSAKVYREGSAEVT